MQITKSLAHLFLNFLICSGALSLSKTALSAPLFENYQQIVLSSNFQPYYDRHSTQNIRPVKIAILDNGFRGYQQAIGRSLPADTHIDFVQGPMLPPEPQENHGLVMAQIVTELMTNAGQIQALAPKLYLFNTYGFTNFQSAVTKAIENNVDIILYSQVWEYGGNDNGSGFINGEVNRARDHKIIWINAVGDFGRTLFSSPIKTVQDEWMQLPDPNNSVVLECRGVNKCPVRMVASWNSFKNKIDLGTAKDLDLYLFDDTLNMLSSSELKQMETIPEGTLGASLYPREIIQTTVKPGRYFIRVKVRSQNFDSRDRMRIAISGQGLILTRADLNENILPPADNSRVIAVAGTEFAENSRSRKWYKPDLIAHSGLNVLVPIGTENGGTEDTIQYTGGSSIAAAVVAAGAGLVKSFDPQLTAGEFLKKTKIHNSHNSTVKGNYQNPNFYLPDIP